MDLLILGDAPCLFDDLDAIGRFDGAVCAVNGAGLRYLDRIDYWCSYHPEMFWKEWRRKRADSGGNTNFAELSEHSTRNIPISGSSVLLATVWGLERFDKLVIAGAPLDDEHYRQYRIGWENEAKHFAGRVVSLSGWTKTFLEGLEWR